MDDAHAYYGVWPHTAEALVSHEQLVHFHELGIDRVCLCSTKALLVNSRAGNDELLHFTHDYETLLPVLVLPHRLEDEGDPDEYLGRNVRLFRAAEGWPSAADTVLRPWFERLSEHRCTVYITYREEIHTAILALANCYPNLRILLTGVNYPQLAGAMHVLKNTSNTMLELSAFQLCDGIRFLCDRVGPRRLLFGTNAPLYTPESAILKLQRAPIDERSRRLIAQENLRRLLEGDDDS